MRSRIFGNLSRGKMTLFSFIGGKRNQIKKIRNSIFVTACIGELRNFSMWLCLVTDSKTFFMSILLYEGVFKDNVMRDFNRSGSRNFSNSLHRVKRRMTGRNEDGRFIFFYSLSWR